MISVLDQINNLLEKSNELIDKYNELSERMTLQEEVQAEILLNQADILLMNSTNSTDATTE